MFILSIFWLLVCNSWFKIKESPSVPFRLVSLRIDVFDWFFEVLWYFLRIGKRSAVKWQRGSKEGRALPRTLYLVVGPTIPDFLTLLCHIAQLNTIHSTGAFLTAFPTQRVITSPILENAHLDKNAARITWASRYHFEGAEGFASCRLYLSLSGRNSLPPDPLPTLPASAHQRLKKKKDLHCWNALKK